MQVSEALRLRVLSLYDRHLSPDGRALDYKGLSADPGVQLASLDIDTRNAEDSGLRCWFLSSPGVAGHAAGCVISSQSSMHH